MSQRARGGAPPGQAAPKSSEVARDEQISDHHGRLGDERPDCGAAAHDSIAADEVATAEAAVAALPGGAPAVG
ncbi:hypothetical protein LCGC14_2488460, partial [marine sediment metagenome]